MEFEPSTVVHMKLDLSAVSHLEGGLNLVLERAAGGTYRKLRMDSVEGMPELAMPWPVAVGDWYFVFQHDAGTSQQFEFQLTDLSAAPKEPLQFKLK